MHAYVYTHTHTHRSFSSPDLVTSLTREYSSILESIALGIQEYKELTCVRVSE